jgi:GNAT superfamily N-acetyltransferase
MSQEIQDHAEPETTAPRIRPGTSADLPALHDILVDAVWDLAWRIGIQDSGRVPTPEERAEERQIWQPLLEHLTATADQLWVAERDGKLVGYARSILRDGVRELTEFFVSPEAQTDGIGAELLMRAMPPGARRTYIMATIDLRAQARYHKLGVYQICSVFTFHREPERVTLPEHPSQDDLAIIPITADHLSALGNLDLAVHGHRRDEDHAWLMKNRSGFLLLRQDRPVGYGYVGPFSGPFAMLDEADFPTALAHAENLAVAQGNEEFGVDVPMLNRTAIDYLLGRKYKLSPFFCFYMCDARHEHISKHVGKTIITSPMIMI